MGAAGASRHAPLVRALGGWNRGGDGGRRAGAPPRGGDGIGGRRMSDIEELLHESEERFRTMADTAPVLLWMAGTDGLCNFFNRGWLDFTGRTMAQETGNGWAEGVHAEDFQRCMN